jgi:putative tricarboxylic transport membrane protein
MEKQKTNFDFLTGLITIVIGIVYGIMSYMLKRSPMGNPLSPSIFPLILASGMVLFGIILLLRSDMETTKRAFAKVKATATANDKLSQKMIFATVAAAIVYALLLERAGYVIATFLFMGFILTITNGKKWVQNIITALVFSVVVYYVFSYLLGVILPKTPFLNF